MKKITTIYFLLFSMVVFAQDYQIKFEKDVKIITDRFYSDMDDIYHLKPSEKPTDLKEGRGRAKRLEIANNERLIQEEAVYRSKVKDLETVYNRVYNNLEKIRDRRKYEAEEKAKKIAKEKEERARSKAKYEEGIKQRKLKQEEASRLAEIESDIRQAEWAKIPTDPKYKQWVSKYNSLISKSKSHMNRCESIISKYTYRNAFGQKMYDKSDFSKSDYDTFINNLESIKNINSEINDLKESNRDYFWVWNDSASMEESAMQNLLYNYYNNKRW